MDLTNYLKIQLKIPILNLDMALNYKEIFLTWIYGLPSTHIELYEHLNYFSITFIINDLELANEIEKILDSSLQNNNRIQYNILLYKIESKYPKSIRINTNGKKIITKKQKKIFIL